MTLEVTQGFRLVASIWPWVGLFLVLALAYVRGPGLRPATWAVILALVTGLTAAAALPLYSPYRPQHLNVRYYQDDDAQKAFVHLSTRGAPPRVMAEAIETTLSEQAPFPWTKEALEYLAPVESAGLPSPELVVEESREIGSGREVRLKLRSARDAWMMRLHLPPDAGARRLLLGGLEMELKPGEDEEDPGFISVGFTGVQSREVELTLHLDSVDPVRV
jgi:hypothetical protein